LDTVPSTGSIYGLCRLDHARFIVSTIDGQLSLYELDPRANLELLAQRHIHPPVSVQVAADIALNPEREILGIDTEWNLVALNTRLGTMARRALEINPDVSVQQLGILKQRSGSPVLQLESKDFFYNLSASPNPDYRPLYSLAVRYGPLLGGIVALGLIVAALMVLRRGRKSAALVPKAEGSLSDDSLRQLRESLLLATDLTGHGGLSATRVLRRLVFLLEAVGGVTHSTPETVERLAKTAKDFKEITIPQMERIHTLASALRMDRVLLERISTSTKDILQKTDELRIARWSPEAVKTAHPVVIDAMKRLEADLQTVASEARRFVTLPLVPEIERAAATVLEESKEKGVSIEVTIDPSARSCAVRAAPGDLAIILENLLANAVQATQQQPIREIRVTVGCDQRHATIEVQDTGHGIERQFWESIFEPGFSSKPVGGTGLFASRKLLNGVGGTIQVKESRIGSGTTMQVRLLIDSTADQIEQGQRDEKADV
jgi:signal transduction histidine kinase